MLADVVSSLGGRGGDESDIESKPSGESFVASLPSELRKPGESEYTEERLVTESRGGSVWAVCPPMGLRGIDILGRYGKAE